MGARTGNGRNVSCMQRRCLEAAPSPPALFLAGFLEHAHPTPTPWHWAAAPSRSTSSWPSLPLTSPPCLFSSPSSLWKAPNLHGFLSLPLWPQLHCHQSHSPNPLPMSPLVTLPLSTAPSWDTYLSPPYGPGLTGTPGSSTKLALVSEMFRRWLLKTWVTPGTF